MAKTVLILGEGKQIVLDERAVILEVLGLEIEQEITEVVDGEPVYCYSLKEGKEVK